MWPARFWDRLSLLVPLIEPARHVPFQAARGEEDPRRRRGGGERAKADVRVEFVMVARNPYRLPAADAPQSSVSTCAPSRCPLSTRRAKEASDRSPPWPPWQARIGSVKRMQGERGHRRLPQALRQRDIRV